ncbi:MAG: SUMF1/EgtB/PvdO family nonheme iron enzyme [Desulforegulaceae bacterium]|nr:SUMF1/EgtB/PvdO family nonheme iron enzyme [Desulforegulaceae bacterium]
MKNNKFNKKSILYILIILIFIVYSRVFFVVFSDKEVSGNTCLKKQTKLNKVFVEKTTGLKFVRMDSGEFYMGSPESEDGRKSDEGPLTRVCINEFMISESETRVKDFSLFVSQTNYITTAEKEGFSYIYSPLTGRWEKKTGVSWKKPGFEQTEDHPVVHLSFFDAMEFANWLDQKYKQIKIGLPSEHQWEYAAKKGYIELKNKEEICLYSNSADLSAKGNFPGWKISSCEDGFVFTAPVKSFNPDTNGLYDMAGNVWEWCDSEYKPYISSQNLSVYGKKKSVVIKGGSFYSKPEFLRFSAREHLNSGKKRAYDLGFRLVITGND